MTPRLISRIGMWLAAWVLATVVIMPMMLGPGGTSQQGYVLLAELGMFFAAGLFFFAGDVPGGGVTLAAAGWLVYAILTGLLFTTRSETRYWKMFGLLCALLALNVFGCGQILGRVKLS